MSIDELKNLYLSKNIINNNKIDTIKYVNIIKTSKLKCLCKNIKYCSINCNLLYNIAMQCSKICNFCNFKSKYDLYFLLKKLQYNQIKEIIGFNIIINNFKIVSDIVESYGITIPYDELNIFITKYSDILLQPNIVNNLFNNIIKYNLKENNAKCLFISLLNTESFIAKYLDIVIKFLIVMINRENINEINKLNLDDSIYSHIIEQIICNCDFKYFEIILNSCNIINIRQKYFKYINDNLSVQQQELLFNKMENIVNYISYINKYHTDPYNDIYCIYNELELFVNPCSLNTTLFTKDNAILFENLTKKQNTYVKYINNNGNVLDGDDLGGLTKDFYSLIEQEIKQYFVEIDGYLIPKSNSLSEKIIWYFYGIMSCRSILFENISPNINIHPLICWLIVKISNNNINIESCLLKNIKTVFTDIRLFDIEYLKNVEKIFLMEKTDYIYFIELQMDQFMLKKNYVNELLSNRYFNEETELFIKGFTYTMSNYVLINYIDTDCLHKYFYGKFCYKILENNHHSLLFNLQIKNNLNDENINNDIFNRKNLEFKKKFCNILEELNKKNINKLKLFFTFWFGQSSITSFSTIIPKIVITQYKIYDCFKSSTCFNTLYIYEKDAYVLSNFDKIIMQLIDNSIKNQELCMAIGDRMQLM
jgi:hypothetical protein